MSRRTEKTKSLAQSVIITDGGTQARAALDPSVIVDYASAVRAGAKLPPVTVFSDGHLYWLADGFHRFQAHKSAGAHEIECVVVEGAQRDAILFACGANWTHGHRRTNADKRRAVEILLRDDEWRLNADNWIAETAHVDNHTVAAVRETLGIPKPPRVRAKNGTIVDTTNIGKQKQDELMMEPEAIAQTICVERDVNLGVTEEVLLGAHKIAITLIPVGDDRFRVRLVHES